MGPANSSRQRFPALKTVSRLLKWSLVTFPHAARAAVLVLAALVLAAASNAANPLGIRWVPSPDGRIGIPRAFESKLPEISAQQARKMIDSGGVIVVDARDAEDYEKDHLPDAINIPMTEWHESRPKLQAAAPKDAKILLYCYGGACGLATQMGKRLLELGYHRPVVLNRGWAAWTKAEYPTEHNPTGKAK